MLQPAINIVITADEDALRLIMSTIGVVCLCWVGVKALAILSNTRKSMNNEVN